MNPTGRDPSAIHDTVHAADGTPVGVHTTGAGPGLLLVGGALRTSHDYLPLATALARSFTVHSVERRGRGASGPLGPGYSLDTEVSDLLAVSAHTGARSAFGHSYGGLVVLDTARRHGVFDRVAVYEPGVPCAPVPTAWMPEYRRRLAAGDPHGAFAHFIQGSGGAPAFLARMPYWYLRLALRVGFRGAAWRRMRPLLEANLAEHEQVAAQEGRLHDYAAVTAPVLILRGGRTPRPVRREFDTLRATLSRATLRTLPGLDHFGPEGRSAGAVAQEVAAFLS